MTPSKTEHELEELRVVLNYAIGSMEGQHWGGSGIPRLNKSLRQLREARDEALPALLAERKRLREAAQAVLDSMNPFAEYPTAADPKALGVLQRVLAEQEATDA